MSYRATQRRDERLAVERLDVLEDEIPRATCAHRDCQRESHYAMAGHWRTFYVCSRHRPLYRRHLQILQRISAIYSRS